MLHNGTERRAGLSCTSRDCTHATVASWCGQWNALLSGRPRKTWPRPDERVECLAMKRRSPTRGRGVVVVKQFFAPAGFRLGGKDFLRVEMSVLGKKRGRKRGFGGMESN